MAIVWTAEKAWADADPAKYEGYEPYGDYYGRATVAKREFVGAVLDTGEYNGYHDSDFYAVVWDGEKVKRVEYATTRFGDCGNSATPDATPEVKEAAAAYLAKHALAAYLGGFKAKVKAILGAVRMGSEVVVFKGRKVKKGTVGEVRWIGNTMYGTRVRIETASGESHFTDLKNVKVHGRSIAENRAEASKFAAETLAGGVASKFESLKERVLRYNAWRSATAVPGWAVL